MANKNNKGKKYDPNTVTIGGRLTRDPELTFKENQKAFTVISVANNQGEQVNFISIPVWGKQAEDICKYMSKGRYVIVEGKLISFTKSKDNKNETVLMVGFPRVYFMPDGKNSNNQSNSNSSYSDNSNPQGNPQGDSQGNPQGDSVDDFGYSPDGITDDDLPF